MRAEARRVAVLDWLVPGTAVEVHPADAARLGIADAQRVRVRSRRGAFEAWRPTDARQ
jgi:anaerobic selenocysteine-containing dehydrogenase